MLSIQDVKTKAAAFNPSSDMFARAIERLRDPANKVESSGIDFALAASNIDGYFVVTSSSSKKCDGDYISTQGQKLNQCIPGSSTSSTKYTCNDNTLTFNSYTTSSCSGTATPFSIPVSDSCTTTSYDDANGQNTIYSTMSCETGSDSDFPYPSGFPDHLLLTFYANGNGDCSGSVTQYLAQANDACIPAGSGFSSSANCDTTDDSYSSKSWNNDDCSGSPDSENTIDLPYCASGGAGLTVEYSCGSAAFSFALSAGAIAGIVIGILVILIGGGAAYYFLIYKKKQQNAQLESDKQVAMSNKA